MPRTIEVTLFTYKELTGKAKERAKEWMNERYTDSSDDLHHCFIAYLHEWGYPTCDIGFRYSYSQGDGMAFYTGSRCAPDFSKGKDSRLDWAWHCHGPDKASSCVNLEKVWWRRGLWKNYTKDERKQIYRLYNTYLNDGFELEISITRNSYGSHYSHYNTMSVSLYARVYNGVPEEDANLIESFADRVERDLQDDVRDASKELDVEADKIIESKQTDAYFDELAESNEFEFTETGDPA